jgi:hypothetical protein
MNRQLLLRIGVALSLAAILLAPKLKKVSGSYSIAAIAAMTCIAFAGFYFIRKLKLSFWPRFAATTAILFSAGMAAALPGLWKFAAQGDWFIVALLSGAGLVMALIVALKMTSELWLGRLFARFTANQED